MTSTDEHRDTDPLLTATAGEVEQGIRREIFKHPETCAAAEIAEIAMVVVGPVIDAKDDEIRRLRTVIRSAAAAAENAVGERLAVLELNARASERVRCAAYLDSIGFTDAAGVLATRTTGQAVDVSKTGQT